ncbi:MAG: glycoside hydrolase family 44 protein [Gemmatimonadaceae bacterium]|nr:glycoside hydrolase family 44 protein [Gemmatimonadaceae bacterium]
MRTHRHLVAAAVVALATLASGCADQRAVAPAEPQLAISWFGTTTVSPTSASVASGSTTPLTATYRDRRGRIVTSRSITWSSADPAIATVSATGLVTGVAAGTVVVTANRSGVRGTARITVTGGTVPPSATPPVTPPPTGPSDVAFTIDGSATYPISRFIYGGNFINEAGAFGNATVPSEFTFNRMGGNRMTAYNWENNHSNAGSDYYYQNTPDNISGTTAGGSVSRRATPTFARGQAFMATISMIGHVSANGCNCSVGTTTADRATRLSTYFRVSRAAKGSPFTLTPNAADGVVYQDEFVNWFETTYPGRSSHPTAPVFYSLDNEPDIWHATHKEINSDLNDNASTPRLQTYSAFTDTSIVYAKAIKAVAPNALVFGPATATYTGISLLGRYPTPDPVYGTQNFTDIYLDKMRAAGSAAGRRLLDVFDVHFYPEAGTSAGTIVNDYATQDAAMIQARVQAPRSLWDPTYTDNSWVPSAAGGPVRLIPRLREQIAARYPGTKLAITEYYYGRGGDISGGVAQADVFGIFGREGVFAASVWPFAGLNAAPYNGDGNKAYAFIFGALRMFRNYDGAGSAFGDLGLKATTSDIVNSSVYASRDAAGNLVLVAINKATTSKVASVQLRNVAAMTKARAYLLSAASATPARQADLVVASGALTYSMPAMSVSTIVITP